MKRVVLLFVLGVVLVSGVFGGGKNENTEKKQATDKTEFVTKFWFDIEDPEQEGIRKKINVNITYDNGVTKATLNIPNKENDFILYTILKKEDIYINPTIEENNNVGNWVQEIFDNTNKDGNTAVFSIQNDKCTQLSCAEYWKKNYDISWLSNEQKHEIRKVSDISFSWIPAGEEIIFDLLMIRLKYGIIVTERIQISIFPEFFEGEKELFDEIENLNYTEKVIAFISTLFKNTEDLNKFKQAIKTYFDPDINDTVFNTFHNYDGDLLKYQTNFKRAMVFNLIIKEDSSKLRNPTNGFIWVSRSVPYLDIHNKNIRQIYGNKRNIYITMYLFYLFDIDKPLLSTIIRNYLRRGLTPYFKYDYKQYKRMDESEGELLSKMALRYLTWGVEYTPFPAANTVSLRDTNIAVSDAYSSKILKWMKENGERQKNYLTGSYATIESIKPPSDIKPKEVHVLEGSISTNRIQLIGHMTNSSTAMKTSRIDVWASKNIAWETGRIIDIVVGGCSTYGQSGLIKDKKISTNAAENFLLCRKDDNEMKIGYKFSGPEKISAICVVRGKAYDTSGHDYDIPDKQELIEIRCGVGGDSITDWITLDGHKGEKGDFIEYITIPKDYTGEKNQMKIYGAAYRQPGFGLYTSYWDGIGDKIEDKQVMYSYLVFKEPVLNCKQIEIIDKTGNPYLYISELMVFPENPLQYSSQNETKYLNYIDEAKTKEINNQQTALNYIGNGILTKGDNLGEGEEIKKYDIVFNSTIDLETIVIWEVNANPDIDSFIYTSEIQILYGTFMIDDPALFAETNNITYEINGLTTPFVTLTKKSIGNPLPYAPKGIDSPRTFAYKMCKQYLSREWYKKRMMIEYPEKEDYIDDIFTKEKTTSALDGSGFENYNSGYVDEMEAFKLANKPVLLSLSQDTFKYTTEFPAIYPQGPNYDGLGMVIKPFLPGLMLNNQEGCIDDINSLYCPDKIAGVDSLGMLMGSVSMAGFDNVYNANNLGMSYFLDGYYKMESDKILFENEMIDMRGFDKDGKPVFYAEDKDSFMDMPLRFSRSDIERSTVIIPDIKLIQKGDLLVNYNVIGEPHIGIVVGFMKDKPAKYGTDIKDFWDNVIVVSVRRGFRMVNIGTWGNRSGNVFGGFTADPEDYHIRRLLLFTGDEFNEGEEVDWEIVDYMMKEIKIDMDLPDTFYTGTNHWIPNTNEYLEYITIKITGISFYDNEVQLPDRYKDVIILPPEDYYFKLDEAKDNNKSNVYTNKGEGIELWAGEGGDRILLATFIKKDYDEFLTKDSYYNVIYSEYFHTDGQTKENCRLFIDDYDYLVFQENNPDGTLKMETRKFSVKAHGTKIRTGDDFLLRFGLAGNPSVCGVVDNRDKIAVYDKKLLWRANLFINEGDNDWNNVHTWTNEDNTWRIRKEIIKYDYENLILPNIVDQEDKTYFQNSFTFNDNLYLSEYYVLNEGVDEERIMNILADVEYYKTQGGQVIIKPWTFSGDSITDRVAYGFACADSVFNFNDDMEDQVLQMIEDKKTLNPEGRTLAPNDKWDNYSSTSYRPYYNKKLAGTTPERIRYTAGVDCEAFCKQAWSYSPGKTKIFKYEFPEDKRDTLVESPMRDHYAKHPDWVVIYDDTEKDKEIFSLLKPGDIVILTKETGHWAIVREVVDKDKNGYIEINEVMFIESSVWSGEWYVMIHHSYEDYRKIGWHGVFYRLIPKE